MALSELPWRSRMPKRVTQTWALTKHAHIQTVRMIQSLDLKFDSLFFTQIRGEIWETISVMVLVRHKILILISWVINVCACISYGNYIMMARADAARYPIPGVLPRSWDNISYGILMPKRIAMIPYAALCWLPLTVTLTTTTKGRSRRTRKAWRRRVESQRRGSMKVLPQTAAIPAAMTVIRLPPQLSHDWNSTNSV